MKTVANASANKMTLDRAHKLLEALFVAAMDQVEDGDRVWFDIRVWVHIEPGEPQIVLEADAQ